MATDFWASSHYKRWITDRAALKAARSDDIQYVDDPEYLDFLPIYFANCISKLGKKLQLRQRVIATATVFFHRFYTRNSYCETEPFIVVSACCYVAAKAEESPVHIKNVISESRTLFSQHYNMKTFPTDNSKLAEMEFYLVDDLACDLIVFHPYRSLLAICKKVDDTEGGSLHEAEAGEVGAGIDDGPRYWGTGEGQLELDEGALQTAWFIINDTYRSLLCLLYPPHLIALTAIYLTLVLHAPTRIKVSALLPSHTGEPQDTPQPTPTMQPRRSSRQVVAPETKKPQDPISFFADLNVSLSLITTIAQEIISLYTRWDRYKEDAAPDTSSRSFRESAASPMASGSNAGSPSKRSYAGTNSNSGTPAAMTDSFTFSSHNDSETGGQVITPVFLGNMLTRMRERRALDIAHPPNGRPVVINRMMDRMQQ